MPDTNKPEIPFNSMLAPLAGISDLPFRRLCRKFGCSLAYIPMISAKSIVYGNENTEKMLAMHDDDRPLGIQFFGREPEMIAKAMEITSKFNFNTIDLNAACPVSKVTKKGEGAGLMEDPKLIQEILKVMVKNSDVPVSLKIRAGWSQTNVNAKEVALYAQDAGISTLIIHGRTRSQKYSGRVDFNIIKEVKEALDIPVIGSGDAFSAEMIKQMMDETGCDHVAIARGALGNPWIFKETEEFLKTGKIPERPDITEIAETMIEHLNAYVDFYGEYLGVMIFRKFFGWYTKGFYNIKPLRGRAFLTSSQNEMTDIINELHGLQTGIRRSIENDSSFPGITDC
jgi:tRNA-dihydrouridine synthase B